MAAERALPFYEAEAKERQREAGEQYGEKHPKEELPQLFAESLESTRESLFDEEKGTQKVADVKK